MQLIFEICGNWQGMPGSTRNKVFDGAGGVIGRGADCDWVIPDPSRQLSNHHALISFRDDQYFLTDISSNGICLGDSAVRLRKGQARPIGQGMVFRMGPFDIRTQLVAVAGAASHSDNLIPDDAFLQLDSVRAMNDPAPPSVAPNWTDTSTVERHHVIVPTLVEPGATCAPAAGHVPAVDTHERFWRDFSEALGVCLEPLDEPGRQALAVKAAGLLRQAIEGLQQNLHTHQELTSELNTALGRAPTSAERPLMCGAQALEAMLVADRQGQLPAEQMITQAYRDLQVHQVAVLAGCRAAMRGALAAFAPGQLLACFQTQGNTPWIPSSGAYWRAYLVHYQRLVEEDGWTERLLSEDFANAYTEQVRLVSTLHSTCSG